MSDKPIDPETIAAFVDGTLKRRERTRVIRALARDEELYEMVVEAMAVRREVPPHDMPAPVPTVPERIKQIFESFRPIPRRAAAPIPWWRRPLPAAAASLAAAAVAALLIVPQLSKSAGLDPLQLTAHASWQQSGGSAALGEDWNQIEWPASRSDAPTTVPTNAAFRAGILLVNIEVAAKLNDSARATSAGGELAEVMRSVDGGGMAAAAAEATTAPARRELRRTLEDRFGDSPWYALGLWLGQARLAAIAGDMSFFAPDARATRELQDLRSKLEADPAIDTDVYSQAALNHTKNLLNQISAGRVSGTTLLSESLGPILDMGASVR
ncbi:MAG: hypothetical protein ACREMA_02955 [Longimicrobiales bacterium]